MYSKVVLIVIQVLFFTGCSWWGGEVEDNKVVEVNILGTSTNCIDNINTFFADYFKGQSQQRDVEENISCIKDVSEKIFERAKENSVKKGFTRAEIRTVLEKVFPRKEKEQLNDNVEILFLIKRLFVGGGKDRFARSEKDSFYQALDEVQKEMIKARLSIRHLFYFHSDSIDDRNFSYGILERSFKAFDSIRARFGGELTEEEALGIVDYIFKGKKRISKYGKIARLAKTYLFGEGLSFVNSQSEFFTRIYVALEMQSRFQSIDFSNGFLVGETFYDLQKALEIITVNLKVWSLKDRNYTLHIDHIKEMVSRLHEIGIMSGHFSSPKLINKTIGSILFAVFKTKELKAPAFTQFHKIVQDWIRRQNRIISKYNFNWAEGRFDSLKEESVNILKELKTFTKPQFIAKAGSPILIRRGNEKITDQEEYFDSSLKHTLYTFVREFFKAYSSSEVLKRDSDGELYLRVNEMKKIFDDARPLALEMGFANPYTCNSELRSFVEADSFTLNGNGDYILSINEAVEWMGTMISVGSVSKHAFAKIEGVCALPGMTYLGFPFMSRKCVVEELFEKTSVLGDYIPSIRSYLDLLSSDGRRIEFEDKLASWVQKPKRDGVSSYTDILSQSFNSCGQKDFPINRGELNSIIAVSYYVENIFSQFDTTGLRKHKWNDNPFQKWHDKDDPEDDDFIIDGREASAFVNAKLSDPLRLKLVDYYKSNFPKFQYVLPAKSAEALVRKLPESSVKFDRVGIHKLLSTLIDSAFKTKPHQFMKNYCGAVYSSFRDKVSYAKEERLMCLPTENVTF